MDYEDYIIRMNELDKPMETKPEKKTSKLRSFLERTLNNPLVMAFSKDKKSSFTPLPQYRRSQKEEE